MKLGVALPQTEIGSDPLAVRDFAQAVESLGFSHLLLTDHVLGADPDRPGGWDGVYDKNDAFHEPLVTLAYLAGLTRRIELVTSILVLPQRQSALVAKQAAALDLLSGGRLRLGVAVGWNPVEYEALGMPFRDRGARLEEQVELMRALWSRESIDFEGRRHRVSRAGINPRPSRPIPVWLGGGADVVLRRTARIADGWIPGGEIVGPRAAAPAAERLRRYLVEAGRDPEGFPIEGGLASVGGNPERWRRQAAAWRALGATHLYLWTAQAGFTRLEEHIDSARRLQEALGPLDAQR